MAYNYYNQNKQNGLPGQATDPGVGSGFVQPTFQDPYKLPGQQQSPQGGNMRGYYDQSTAFTKPTLNNPNGRSNTMGPKDEPAEGPLSGAGYGEDWYKRYGDDLMRDPSSSERLFDMGVAGSNPYYDYAQQQAIKAINDASAARGNFNSSYTGNLIGKTVADIRGQQAHELNMLAGQADTGRFGRYDRGEKYAGNAQDRMENRANRSLDYEYKLGAGRAGLVGGFYQEGGREAFQATMASIEAALKKAGLTSAEAQQMLNQLSQGVGIVSNFYKPGGGGGGGGSGGAPTGGYSIGGGGSADVYYV